jgi:hypothetical protein
MKKYKTKTQINNQQGLPEESVGFFQQPYPDFRIWSVLTIRKASSDRLQ